MKKIISLLMVTLVLCGSTFCSLNVKAADVDTNIDTIIVDVSIASVDKGIHNKTTKYGLPTY